MWVRCSSSPSGYMTEVEELALLLQSKGPDEYPFGYYMFLARKRLNIDDDSSD